MSIIAHAADNAFLLVRVIMTTGISSYVFGKHYQSDFEEVIRKRILLSCEVQQAKKSRV